MSTKFPAAGAADQQMTPFKLTNNFAYKFIRKITVNARHVIVLREINTTEWHSSIAAMRTAYKYQDNFCSIIESHIDVRLKTARYIEVHGPFTKARGERYCQTIGRILPEIRRPRDKQALKS
jgi:hypothetical protein